MSDGEIRTEDTLEYSDDHWDLLTGKFTTQ